MLPVGKRHNRKIILKQIVLTYVSPCWSFLSPGDNQGCLNFPREGAEKCLHTQDRSRQDSLLVAREPCYLHQERDQRLPQLGLLRFFSFSAKNGVNPTAGQSGNSRPQQAFAISSKPFSSHPVSQETPFVSKLTDSYRKHPSPRPTCSIS